MGPQFGAAAVLALPEAVTEHRHWTIGSTSALVVLRGKEAAEMRRDAERFEEPAADEQSLGRPRFTAGTQIEARIAKHRHAHQDLLLIA